MNLAANKVFLSLLAIAMVAIAIELPGDLTSAGAAMTVTVTEQVCMTDWAGKATPLSVANAMATAADASDAASLIASMMADGDRGYAASLQLAADATTVTTVANATNCPAPPAFDLSPTGLFSSLLNDELSNTAADNADTNGTARWSQGRNSLCFTSSNWVGLGWYAIYLDGYGQEKDGCGKGALDNLHGQCNDVWYWTCRHWGSGVLLVFYLPAPPRKACVIEAMWHASPNDKRENGLCCVYLGESWLSSNTSVLAEEDVPPYITALIRSLKETVIVLEEDVFLVLDVIDEYQTGNETLRQKSLDFLVDLDNAKLPRSHILVTYICESDMDNTFRRLRPPPTDMDVEKPASVDVAAYLDTTIGRYVMENQWGSSREGMQRQGSCSQYVNSK